MLLRVMTIALEYDLPEDGSEGRRALSYGRTLLAQSGVEVPALTDWPSAMNYLADFVGVARTIGDSAVSRHIAEHAEALARHDPAAAVLPAAAVVAEWEGSSKESWLFSTQSGALDWGWHGLVLPLARILAELPALWSARRLVGEALDGMRLGGPQPPAWYAAEALAGFHELRDQLEEQYIEQRDSFVRDIRRACAPANAPIRSPLAALWWTIGDPWHAHGLSNANYNPSFRQLSQLIHRVLSTPYPDTMLAATAERLWRTPGLDADRHPIVHRRMTRYLIPPGQNAELEAVKDRLGVSPSAAYSRALTSFFAGTSSSSERATISALVPLVQAIGGPPEIRFRALALLLKSAGGKPVQGQWRDLAQRAAIVGTDLGYLRPYSYDRSADLPLYYLEGHPDLLFGALERQRTASMDFVLRALRPPTDASRETEHQLADEDGVLREIRILRHGQRLPRLAQPSLSSRSLRIGDRETADELALSERLPAIRDRLQRLDTIRSELAAVARGYVALMALRARCAADLALALGTGSLGIAVGARDDAASPLAAMELNPEMRLEVADALIDQAIELDDLGEYEAEVASYDELVSRFGNDPGTVVRERVAKALLYKALTLSQLGQPDEEIRSYEDIVERFGHDPSPGLRVQVARGLLNLAVVRSQLNQDQAALAAGDEVVSRFGEDGDPDLREAVARALINKGFTCGRLGQHEAALAASEDLVARFGEDPDQALRVQVAKALVNEGVSLSHLGRTEEQLTVYADIVARFGEDPDPALRAEVSKARRWGVAE
jgi:tetratricopeptide (TPR) repeat protein